MHQLKVNELPHFFSGTIDNGIKQLIKKLETVKLQKTYAFDKPQLYNGNILSLQHAGRAYHDVQFVQTEAPPFIQTLSSALDSLVAKGGKPISPFDLSSHKAELKSYYTSFWGPLPRREVPKFEPPEL